MSVWQDSLGGLHDDMSGEALSLPTWPQGMILLTDAQVAAIRSTQAPPQPNGAGFVAALKTAMGGPIPANALMRQYPLFYDAVMVGQWGDVQALVLDAKTTGAITATQYTAFQSAVVANNIPITLP